MAFNQGLFLSGSEEAETPQEFFEALDADFHFDLDPASSHENAKCERHYTKEDDGLSLPWEGTVFCNPPYGREIGKWVQKGYEESLRGNTVVMLLPARTDTRWFHEYVMKAWYIYFIKGRLRFSGAENSAPFPSMVVHFQKFDNPHGCVLCPCIESRDTKWRRIGP